MVSVPARGGPVVEATVNVTGTDPLPFAFELIVIHGESEAAVQVQRALDARTSTVPLPPL
jgi:hypothetical protein